MVTKATLFAALTVSAGAAVYTTAAAPVAAWTPTLGATPAQAPPETPAERQLVTGTIVSLDLENNTFKLKINGEGEKDKEIEVKVNDETKYMLDREEAEKDEVLVKDKRVMVRRSDGVATMVSRRTAEQPPREPETPRRPGE